MTGTAPDASLGPAHRPARRGTFWRRLRRLYGEHIGPTEQSLLASWASFGVTFGLARLVTYGIRGGWLPVKNIESGGRHYHHYNIGILVLLGVGLVGIHGLRQHARHPVTASAYGVGAALIADEFALLLDLEDVYWTKEGRISVDAALVVIAGLGLYLSSVPFWHGLVRELRRPVRHQAEGVPAS
ncbi:MAG TPA: hypothetical protein VIA06_19405 [Candidatus Dormibacteraeota bacterium]|jgi:hypothetical protein|nr:hypothetical protein [Candidatus Dormibacteraeota bacterium]